MKNNEKYIAFVNEYFENGFQCTKAYMKIFGSRYEIAGANAVRLMGKPKIRELIEEKQAEILERAKIRKEDILTQLMNIAYDNGARNIDRIKALEQINKMLGYLAPTEAQIKFTGEARLFSDDDLEIK